MKDSTKYANDYNILQNRLCQDGYLLIRNFIDTNHAESIRESISLKLWNKPNYRSSIITGNDPRTSFNYNSAYSLECVHQFWHSSRIKNFFEKLFKEEVLMHPKIVLRNSYKGTFTPAHQDWPQFQDALEVPARCLLHTEGAGRSGHAVNGPHPDPAERLTLLQADRGRYHPLPLGPQPRRGPDDT